MKPIQEQLKALQAQVKDAMERIRLDQEEDKLARLETDMQRPDFWSDAQRAEQISREAASIHKDIDQWHSLESDIDHLLELAKISSEADIKEFEQQLAELNSRAKDALTVLKLSGPYDKNPAILQISAGVGGTDAQDWAQMLLSMYTRYCERAGLHATLVDVSYGEEAGIKSATLEITGPYAYGRLQSEKGVHRLVRISPFNAQGLRQTSFALVDVVPEIADEAVELDPKDLRIDTYRSSGHGGQSVNTTDSAVRITHLPTGLVVSIQNERSQLKNKTRAMTILASRLAELAREQHADSIAALRGQLKSADWGAQIRSYVLHPYTKVKDHRTDFETSDTQAVLNGELEPFIDSYLNQQLSKKGA